MSKSTSQPYVGPAGRAASARKRRAPSGRTRRLARSVWKHRWLYLLMMPSLIYFAIFRYVPLWNAQIAFKDFNGRLGVLGSPWVGLKHFNAFIHSFYFGQLIGNTLFFSLAKLILGIPMAIILAVALYESSLPFLRRVVQTASYLPHFLSWVIVFGVLLAMLSPGNGLFNEIIKSFGGQPIPFLTSSAWFRVVVIGSEIWKETGWGTILYLAALLAIEPALFEAAEMDGASRLQRIWHISLPGILPVIVIVTLLRMGTILDAGFNQIFVLYSLPVYSVGDIIDTWVYRAGILDGRFSLATSVGLFKGVIGLVMIVTANRLARRVAGSGLY